MTRRAGTTGSRCMPARDGVRLDAVDPFDRYLVVFEREDGGTRMRVDRARHRSVDPGRPARVAVHRVGRGQPGVRRLRAPVRVHLPRHAPVGLRPRPRVRRTHPPEASARAGRLRPRPVPHRAAVGHGRGRHPGAPLPRLPRRPGRRPGPGPRALPASSTDTAPTRRRWTPRSRRCGSACSTGGSCSPSPTSGAGASWAATGTRKASSRPSRTPSRTSWPAPVTWWTRGGRPPTGWWPAAGAPAAC